MRTRRAPNCATGPGVAPAWRCYPQAGHSVYRSATAARHDHGEESEHHTSQEARARKAPPAGRWEGVLLGILHLVLEDLRRRVAVLERRDERLLRLARRA